MKLKFLYNTLLTIGIVLLFMSIISSYSTGQYTILAVSVGLMLFLIYLKVNLLKGIREATRSTPTNSESKATKKEKK
jgi:hypothetical protein